jgi:V/A-type H+-transporting ATPase subunit F
VDFYFLGDEELVTAFRFIGIEGIAVRDSDEAVATFRRITEGFNETAGIVMPDSFPGTESCQVLIMTEETADWLGDFMIDWQLSGRYPLLVEIPGINGRLEGRKTLVDSIREAIGIHV